LLSGLFGVALTIGRSAARKKPAYAGAEDVPHYQGCFDNVPGREQAGATFFAVFQGILPVFPFILPETGLFFFQRIIDIVSLYPLFPEGGS